MGQAGTSELNLKNNRNGEGVFDCEKGVVNSNLWFLAIIPVLAWFLTRHRMSRALRKAELEFACSPPGLTGDEMGEYVRDLSSDLKLPPRVPSPNLGMDTSHVWNSPSGKRVYMN